VCARGTHGALLCGPSTSPLGLPRSEVPRVLLFLPGVFLGMILIPAALRWALLVHTSLTKQGGDFLGPPRRRLLWFTPVIVLFHPTLYLLAGLIVVSGFALIGRLSAGWLWFLAGFYAYAVMIGLLLIPRMLKLRRQTRDVRKA
jgi:hypothetical protein